MSLWGSSAWPFCCQTHPLSHPLPLFYFSFSIFFFSFHTHCLFKVTTTPEQFWNTSHKGLTAFALLSTVPVSGQVFVLSCIFIKDALLLHTSHFSCFSPHSLKTSFSQFTAANNVDYVTNNRSVLFSNIMFMGYIYSVCAATSDEDDFSLYSEKNRKQTKKNKWLCISLQFIFNNHCTLTTN